MNAPFGAYRKPVAERAQKFSPLIEIFLEWWSSAAAFVATSCGLAMSAWPGFNFNIVGITISPQILFGIAIGSLLLGGIGTFRRKVTLRSREEELTKAKSELAEATKRAELYRRDVEHLFRIQLTALAHECGLAPEGDFDNKVRLTIYFHLDTERCFVPIARVSGNPSFTPISRTTYPDHIGAICEGWEKGVARLKVSAKTDDEWVEEMVNDHNFDRIIAESISMKSRSLLAVRLSVESGPIGVVVIESMNKTQVNVSLEQAVSGSKLIAPLSRQIQAVKESHIDPVTP